MWRSVFDDAFTRLGWKEPPASPGPSSPLPEPPAPREEAAPALSRGQMKRTTSKDRIRISATAQPGNVFDLFQVWYFFFNFISLFRLIVCPVAPMIRFLACWVICIKLCHLCWL